MPRYNEPRPSGRERKLKELAALAQLSGAIEEPQRDAATREHALRVNAAMQMLGLVQQMQEAQETQAFRQQELEQEATLAREQQGIDRMRADNEMLARAGAVSGEAAQRGIALAQDREQADRAFGLDLAQLAVGNMGDQGFSMPMVDRLLSKLSPDMWGASSREVTQEREAGAAADRQRADALVAAARGPQVAEQQAGPGIVEKLNDPETDRKLFAFLRGLFGAPQQQPMTPQFNPVFQSR